MSNLITVKDVSTFLDTQGIRSKTDAAATRCCRPKRRGPRDNR